jgi:hypothetical protein
MEQNCLPSSMVGYGCTHSGKAYVFCNDAGPTMASHFPADMFYKRHLDKKLHCVDRLQREIDADKAMGVAKLRLAIERLA